MKLKKILSGMLAGAMVFTSVMAGNWTVQAESPAPAPDYKYSFEDTIDDATAIIKGLGNYNGQPVYEAGKEGKALRIGNYGLKLNKPNLGNNFTFSMWVKPDGAIADNSPVLFLGYHNPQKWIAVAGKSSSSQVTKVWAHNESTVTWREFGDITIPSAEWSMLTVTGEGESVKVFFNGVLKATCTGVDVLNGANQDIYIGVNNWDTQFQGLVDEAEVYGTTLTDKQVYRLYDTRTAEEIFDETELTVDPAVNAEVGFSDQLSIRYSPYVFGDEVTMVFEGYDSELIDVDAAGLITGKKAGNTVITTKVTVGNVTKQANTNVTVKEVDRTEFERLIAEAEDLNANFYTEDSINALKYIVENHKSAGRQAEIDAAVTAITSAMNALVYLEGYENPWLMIERSLPAGNITLQAGKSVQLFTLPPAVAPYVDVTYSSSDNAVVQYQNGVAKALKAGKATAYVTVNAKNGSSQRYQTIVTVTGSTVTDNKIQGMDKITAVPGKNKIAKDKTTKITLNYPAAVKAANPSVTYQATGAVSVKNGIVTGKKAGTGKVTVTITIPSTGQKETRILSFKVGAINKSSVKKGKSVTLKTKGITGTAKWSISKGKKLANLSKSKGKSVKLKAGKKKGTVTVTATVSGVKITQKIKIK